MQISFDRLQGSNSPLELLYTRRRERIEIAERTQAQLGKLDSVPFASEKTRNKANTREDRIEMLFRKPTDLQGSVLNVCGGQELFAIS